MPLLGRVIDFSHHLLAAIFYCLAFMNYDEKRVLEDVLLTNVPSDYTNPIRLANQRCAIINTIKQLVPECFPEPQDEVLLEQLKLLTEQLIQAYKAAGQLQGDPFEDVWDRRVYCYEDIVDSKLNGSTVLVTGGSGCVGVDLIHALEGFQVKKIIIVDPTPYNHLDKPGSAPLGPFKAHYPVDIRDFHQLDQVFESEKPDIVFHLAALRLPGVAEKQVREAVSTNIFGTQNVISLCEKHTVKQCVFSSTGKASRYVTKEVYAATKKICECLFTQAAQHGSSTYGMVRFTHMLDNSSVCEQYDRQVERGKVVNIHAPDKYICAQNVHEATSLLLNSLALAQPHKLDFLVCRNLGWPVETLEIALYKILQSSKSLPIYFQGCPAGYEEGFFRGQIDWDDPTEANLLVNAIEKATSKIDASGDFIVTSVLPFCPEVFAARLVAVESLLRNPKSSDASIKEALADCMVAVARSTYANAPIELVFKVLNWGTDPTYLGLDGMTLDTHRHIIRLMIESLSNRKARL